MIEGIGAKMEREKETKGFIARVNSELNAKKLLVETSKTGT
jgi:hypothetical protein